MKCFCCHWTPHKAEETTCFKRDEGAYWPESSTICFRVLTRCALSCQEVLCTCAGYRTISELYINDHD